MICTQYNTYFLFFFFEPAFLEFLVNKPFFFDVVVFLGRFGGGGGIISLSLSSCVLRLWPVIVLLRLCCLTKLFISIPGDDLLLSQLKSVLLFVRCRDEIFFKFLLVFDCCVWAIFDFGNRENYYLIFYFFYNKTNKNKYLTVRWIGDAWEWNLWCFWLNSEW